MHRSLTVAQALACAPGAPVYSFDRPQVPSRNVYIVVKDGNATINTATRSTAHSSATFNYGGCWRDWRWNQVGWFGYDNGGNMSAWGFGDHCGYAGAGVPTVSVWCMCTGHTEYSGRYDSKYGLANFGQNAAAAWMNQDLNTTLVHWNNMARIWWDTNANNWSWSYVG